MAQHIAQGRSGVFSGPISSRDMYRSPTPLQTAPVKWILCVGHAFPHVFAWRQYDFYVLQWMVGVESACKISNCIHQNGVKSFRGNGTRKIAKHKRKFLSSCFDVVTSFS